MIKGQITDRVVIVESGGETESRTDESLIGRSGVALNFGVAFEDKEFWVVKLDGEAAPRCILRSRLVTEQSYLENKDRNNSSSATDELLDTVSSLVLLGRSRIGLGVSVAAVQLVIECEKIFEKELHYTMSQILKIKPNFKNTVATPERMAILEKGAAWHCERLSSALRKIEQAKNKLPKKPDTAVSKAISKSETPKE